jgi:hypothetical protein
VYTEKVLEKFGYLLGKVNRTKKYPLPSDAADQLAPDTTPLTEDQRKYITNFPYRSVIGALLYLALHTRPDISYAVGILSRFGTNPSLSLWLHLPTKSHLVSSTSTTHKTNTSAQAMEVDDSSHQGDASDNSFHSNSDSNTAMKVGHGSDPDTETDTSHQ